VCFLRLAKKNSVRNRKVRTIAPRAVKKKRLSRDSAIGKRMAGNFPFQKMIQHTTPGNEQLGETVTDATGLR
jgi:hypothetical protein